jgi:uncharacterized glyoxalase superfamily protein PhnB
MAALTRPAEPDWARMAAAHGFADHAHMVREVRSLTGLSPTALRAERVVPFSAPLRDALAWTPPADEGVCHDRADVSPIVPYPDRRRGADGLERVLGSEVLAVYTPEPDAPLKHGEVRVVGGTVMPNDASRTDDGPFALRGPVVVHVAIDDPDGLHDRGVAAGAEVAMGLTDQPYGSRDFAVRDPGGNVWSIGTHRPPAPG